MNVNAIKRKIASVFDTVGINSLGHFLQRQTVFPFIRIVNYHVIKPENIANFEEHLKFYRAHYVNVDEKMLAAFLETGEWPHDKPGLIISFDDGTSDHFELAAPLLEMYRFTGWFFVPAGWVMEDGGEIPGCVSDGVTPLSQGQLLYLDQNHVIGCHTETHRRLTADLSEEELWRETFEAKVHLQKLLDHEVKSFCWVGGEEYTYNARAAEIISDYYSFGFMTNTAPVTKNTSRFQLQRTNIEAENPLSLVRFQLSGLMDLAYYGKRKRVNKLTTVIGD